MKIGKYEFDFSENAYIMGILNVTPDSFSDGGEFRGLDLAMTHVEKMISEGACIIDVGGESTRPGYDMISAEEEIVRTATVIREIKKRFDIAVSLDTYKSEVAKAGIAEGADMINDIWGCKYDPDMANVIASSKVACCLMHNNKDAIYTNYMEEVVNQLKESVEIAKSAGVTDGQIILDPGVGFGKNYEQNLEIINKCKYICDLGYPVLLGTSRKSVIGITLNAEVKQREIGTAATTVIGYERGCRLFRVHDVKVNMEALKMAEAIVKAG